MNHHENLLAQQFVNNADSTTATEKTQSLSIPS